MDEARITISSIELSEAQSMAVRVAVASMLLMLSDKEHRAALGRIAELYDLRLSEVQALIFMEAR